jgi:hypothetical protein
MSEEVKKPEQEPGEEPLVISNAYLGRISPDAEAMCEAIYALARETRAMREAVQDVSAAVDRLTHEIPVYDGVLQVART